MTVIHRLRRLTGEDARPVQPEGRAAKIGELRRRIDAVMSRRPSGHAGEGFSSPKKAAALADLVEGEVIENEAGRFLSVRRTLPADIYHGKSRIGDLAGIDMNILGCLAGFPTPPDFRLQDGLFLDTETTGLSGGSGTLAFMIGTGWFEGDAFTTCQLFLHDFNEERAALLFLKNLFAGKRFLVTFNGKTFDINLLTTRLLMNRIPGTPFALPHLDLLHSARRLVRHRLCDCRLTTLEENLLGLKREADIPGSEIPARYFGWLRTRNGHLMADVFEHNRLDVISLASLGSYLAGLFVPDRCAYPDDPDDRPEVSRLLLKRGCTGAAVDILKRAGASSGRSAESSRLLSLIYKGTGRWEEAVRLWEGMILADPEDIFAAVELAKWLEHHRREYDRAASLVLQALSCCRVPREAEALRHRLRRLQARSGRGTI